MVERIPTLYWIMMPLYGDSPKGMAREIAKLTANPFRLIACEVARWDEDLSPWPAADVTGSDNFTGEAPKFLAHIEDEIIPRAEASGQSPRIIGGYSMAGLFACWAFLSSHTFQGMVSCSGSLWFEGWLDFARSHKAPPESFAYLSLGDKEPHVRNRAFARVGDATLTQDELFEADENVVAHTFVWNKGGHINDAKERMARGFAWAIDACMALDNCTALDACIALDNCTALGTHEGAL